ncbi:MAG: tRNA (adenosine(37)-N6)-threonylcarbamoyltransferase complex ATPase subunit type 1 TsaE [Bdellovibrionaceae bacterium]|nr:tRNA (adenosine(37)-N6)-threonylcarbamoyltransferase complex ATPase subunit type 1 TsaE [Pseudobdellovibrionaceae bacterium]
MDTQLVGIEIIDTKDINVVIETLKTYVYPKTFIGISGQMGAGKTTLISQLLKDQNVVVASPTFSLHNAYFAFGLTIIHVDLYRLESADEIDSSGFWDLFTDQKSIILAEWIERISMDDVPLDWNLLLLKIQLQSDNQRCYSLFSYRLK